MNILKFVKGLVKKYVSFSDLNKSINNILNVSFQLSSTLLKSEFQTINLKKCIDENKYNGTFSIILNLLKWFKINH